MNSSTGDPRPPVHAQAVVSLVCSLGCPSLHPERLAFFRDSSALESLGAHPDVRVCASADEAVGLSLATLRACRSLISYVPWSPCTGQAARLGPGPEASAWPLSEACFPKGPGAWRPGCKTPSAMPGQTILQSL